MSDQLLVAVAAGTVLVGAALIAGSVIRLRAGDSSIAREVRLVGGAGAGVLVAVTIFVAAALGALLVLPAVSLVAGTYFVLRPPDLPLGKYVGWVLLSWALLWLLIAVLGHWIAASAAT